LLSKELNFLLATQCRIVNETTKGKRDNWSSILPLFGPISSVEDCSEEDERVSALPKAGEAALCWSSVITCVVTSPTFILCALDQVAS